MKIGSTVIPNDNIIDSECVPIKPGGGDVKYSSAKISGSDSYSIFHEGREPKLWDIRLQALDSESTLDSLMKVFNDAGDEDLFYPRTNSRFARIALASAQEDDAIFADREAWRAKARVVSKSPYLFDDGSETTFAPALGALTAITPAGMASAPLDALSVTGHYAGGNHLTTLGLKIWDNAEAVLQDSITISDQLLTDEVLIVDWKGLIAQTYMDNFSAGTKFSQDATNDGCSVGAGVLTVPNEKSCYYLLKGPWPLIKNIVVSANIKISAGTPVLQYSFDGSNWYTAYSGTDLTTYSSWIIPNTRGRGDVYIRFKSQSSDKATLTTNLTGTNNDLTLTSRLTGTTGNSTTLKFTNPGGTGSLSISVVGQDIDVTIARTSGTITSTAGAIAAALMDDLSALALIESIIAPTGNDGSGVVTAMNKTNFSGATVNASMTIDNLQIYQERQITESELPLIPLGATYKVEIDEAAAGSSGSADISATYRDRFWI